MLKNMKIGRRLITAFIIVSVIASISGVLGAYLLTKSDKDYSAALINYGFTSGKIAMLSSEINMTQAYVRDIVFLTEQKQITDAKDNIEKCSEKVDELIIAVNSAPGSAEMTELYKHIKEQIIIFREVRDKVIASGSVNDHDVAYDLWLNQGAPIIKDISTDLEELVNMSFKEGARISEGLTSLGKIFLAIMIASIAVGILVGIILSIYISKGISKPLHDIEDAADKIANGNYDVSIDYVSKDEIGMLSESMRKMVATTKKVIMDVVRELQEISVGNFNVTPEQGYIGVFKKIETALVKITVNLSDTIHQVQIASEQVSSGSRQVSTGSQALAQGATEQASAVEELSASISEISGHVKKSAENAQNASAEVDEIGENIRISNQQMNQMMEAIADISDSSSQIGKIIKTIEDISFQTNILALNASVEAARAGAAGKGFAVVAGEVRNLANKSSDAAKQTNLLIEGSVKSVENGVKIAEETAKSLQDVVEGSIKITALIEQISKASSAQSLSISQVSQGVEQISAVVQTNSATSEESAAASEELNGQASLLEELVSKFKLINGMEHDIKAATSQSYPKTKNFAPKKGKIDLGEFSSSKY